MRIALSGRFARTTACVCFGIIGMARTAPAVDVPESQPRVAIWADDFESSTPGWAFVGGEEFPGAKGALAFDHTRAHEGKMAARLDADFTAGGAYVGMWKNLEPLGLPDATEFRFWVQSKNVDRVGVRLVDSTGQCHQSAVKLPAGAAQGWQSMSFKVADLVGGEHWGGDNDGRWHGPARGFGLNIGKNQVGLEVPNKASLWIDDVNMAGAAVGVPTLQACSISPDRCRPGFGTRINYLWDAEPLGVDCSLFVHFVNAQGQMVFQADHDPATATSRWSGRVEYARTAIVPTDIKPGRYDVVIGFWDPRPSDRGGGRKPFRVGSGLQALPNNACRVGSLEISNEAQLPVLAQPTLDLDPYRLTFDEDFSQPLSISAWGPGTRWIAHTPYAGDFGDARFGDPGKDSPFSVHNGILRIEAMKTGNHWRSGLICSVDPNGVGFSQQYGYFEMRAKLPKGLGTWPAFWLMGGATIGRAKRQENHPTDRD